MVESDVPSGSTSAPPLSSASTALSATSAWASSATTRSTSSTPRSSPSSRPPSRRASSGPTRTKPSLLPPLPLLLLPFRLLLASLMSWPCLNHTHTHISGHPFLISLSSHCAGSASHPTRAVQN